MRVCVCVRCSFLFDSCCCRPTALVGVEYTKNVGHKIGHAENTASNSGVRHAHCGAGIAVVMSGEMCVVFVALRALI